ncbi:MAG TPA: glucose-6-phosphate dehydrogenase [Chloroflexi bacterium]|nr:glucose-6-phosphate dehydrogenase [Chloroflexota bacterium]
MPENENIPGSTALVIFGVTGDLTRRKLIPALYELMLADRLPENFYVIGFARRDWTDDFLREQMRSGVLEFARNQPVNPEIQNRLLQKMFYLQASFDDTEGYRVLANRLAELKIENCLFYLATPPSAYETIVEQLGAANLPHAHSGWTRIVIEKPYGRNLESAIQLDNAVHQVFDESQVYRIDHYLGKETVQNILVFRFANGIFEPLWNRRYVDHVQLTVAETVGVGTRAGYYETSGVIRDMFQNHLLQLLTLTTMEAPSSFAANPVRDEKVKILRSLRPIHGNTAIDETLRAQYVAGTVDGERVPGYKDAPDVSPHSVTETYLAARVYIDNWRWASVPFYIRSGKCMPRQVTEVAIQFKQVPLSLFGWKNLAGAAPNVLVLNIQPDEGITLRFGAKAPGPINQIQPVSMEFNYEETFGGEPPEAYERLLLDCMMGDATLFTRTDEVHAAWSFTTGILEGWAENPVRNLPIYEAGTWGPQQADPFIQRDADQWRNLDL